MVNRQPNYFILYKSSTLLNRSKQQIPLQPSPNCWVHPDFPMVASWIGGGAFPEYPLHAPDGVLSSSRALHDGWVGPPNMSQLTVKLTALFHGSCITQYLV